MRRRRGAGALDRRIVLQEPGAPTEGLSGEHLAGPPTPHSVWAATEDMARSESAESIEGAAVVAEHRRAYRLRRAGAAIRLNEEWTILDGGEIWDILSVGRDERIRAMLLVVAERRRAVAPGGAAEIA